MDSIFKPQKTSWVKCSNARIIAANIRAFSQEFLPPGVEMQRVHAPDPLLADVLLNCPFTQDWICVSNSEDLWTVAESSELVESVPSAYIRILAMSNDLLEVTLYTLDQVLVFPDFRFISVSELDLFFDDFVDQWQGMVEIPSQSVRLLSSGNSHNSAKCKTDRKSVV